MIDTLLTVASWLIQLAVALIAIYLSYQPRVIERRRGLVVITLVTLALCGLVATIFQQTRASNAQEAVALELASIRDNTARRSYLQMTGWVTKDPDELFTIGQGLACQIIYTNLGTQPVSGVLAYTNVLLAKDISRPKVTMLREDQEQNARMLQEQDLRNGIVGATIGPGRKFYVVRTTQKFTAEDLEALHRDQYRLLLFYTLVWTNPDGEKGSSEECLRLRIPPSDVRHEAQNARWLPCLS